MSRITYFHGCSSHGTAKEYDLSVRKVLNILGIGVDDIPDWSCCGASSAHTVNETLSIALPLRNLISAENLQNKVMAVSCAACYSRHKTTNHELSKSPELLQKMKSVVPGASKYSGAMLIKSMLQYFSEDIKPESIRNAVQTPLTGLRVACYYGCLLTRPKEVTCFDSPEYPVSMDKLLESVGAQPTDFDHKTECCGNSFSISNTEIIYDLIERIFDSALDSGADIIAVACPLCQANLDMRQAELEKRKGKKYSIPTVYFTQLLALAFGISMNQLEFHRNFVPVIPVLQRVMKTGGRG
ncbi:MAG: CoB--CoM heterodisulfide reductase iron-sulfur subunit B family protein [Candidatus Riflebacteria bacterium]|nr:CoB--CoM heterodisulfide reductase iron-sulfur subunit B family protein [Candidatus Riflebacteria bacterium]